MPYTDGWTHRIKLTIPASKIDADVLNPVVPVKLSATALASVHSVLGSATTNRKKCAFASMSGTYYYAEIKDWLTGCFFVATDTLNSAVGNEFYFYMSATAADSAYMGDAGESAAQSAWANGINVYNFEQEPVGAGSILDSLGSRDGTPNGSMIAAQLVSGEFGNGIYLDGSDDYISLGSAAVGVTGNYSILCFIKFDEAGATTERIYSKQNGGYAFALTRENAFGDNGKLKWEISLNGSLPYDTSYSNGAISADTWALLSIVYNGSNIKLYIDGDEDTGGYFPRSIASIFSDGVYDFRIGSSGSYDAKLQGTYSHFSFFNENKSEYWINTFYLGLNSDLLTFAAMEGADTIRELIITSIKANLSNITTTNGYNTNAGNLVVRSTEIGGLTSLPGIAIAPGNDTQSDLKSYGYDSLDMPVEITIADTYTHQTTEAANKNAVSQKCEQLLGDLRKAMAQTITNVKMVSYTEGGVNSYPLERNNEMAAVVAVTYTIKYETIKDDPYNQ